MFAWPASKFAGYVARECGASSEDVDTVRFGTAAACFPVDPAGSALGMIHASASAQAREGDKGADFVNKAMSIASSILTIPLPDDLGTTKADA